LEKRDHDDRFGATDPPVEEGEADGEDIIEKSVTRQKDHVRPTSNTIGTV